MNYAIRLASESEVDEIRILIADSARGLSREHYTEVQIEAAVAGVFGVDSDLIKDGTYFVAESSGRLVGCGGWSRRKNLYGGDQFADRDSGVLNPETDAAKIRAFFVHPDCARQGIGRSILAACESAARDFGFRSLELMSTLPGISLYKACGYTERESFDLELADNVILELVKMRKEIA